MTDLIEHQNSAGMTNHLVIESREWEELSLAELRKIGKPLEIKGRSKEQLIDALRKLQINRAIRNGKWEDAISISSKYNVQFNAESIDIAILTRDLNRVKWLLKQGVKPTSFNIFTAVRYLQDLQSLPVIQSLSDSGAECSTESLIIIANQGYINVLKYLISIGRQCPQNVIIYALDSKNKLEMIKYLYSIGIRLSKTRLKCEIENIKEREKWTVLAEESELRKFLEEQHGLS